MPWTPERRWMPIGQYRILPLPIKELDGLKTKDIIKPMGLMFTKYYMQNSSRKEKKDYISVNYKGKIYELESTLDLDSRVSLEYSRGEDPKIILTYDQNDKVLISLRDNKLNFFILVTDDSMQGNKEKLRYPWLSNLDNINISILTEQEYKEMIV